MDHSRLEEMEKRIIELEKKIDEIVIEKLAKELADRGLYLTCSGELKNLLDDDLPKKIGV